MKRGGAFLKKGEESKENMREEIKEKGREGKGREGKSREG